MLASQALESSQAHIPSKAPAPPRLLHILPGSCPIPGPCRDVPSHSKTLPPLRLLHAPGPYPHLGSCPSHAHVTSQDPAPSHAPVEVPSQALTPSQAPAPSMVSIELSPPTSRLLHYPRSLRHPRLQPHSIQMSSCPPTPRSLPSQDLVRFQAFVP